MRMACVFVLTAFLVGCTTLNTIQESQGDHPVAYLAVQAGTQIAAYEFAKSLKDKDYRKVEAIIEAIESIKSPGDPAILDWDRGRAVIADKVKPPYTAGALLVFGILETELAGKVDQGNITLVMVEKYLKAAVIGVKGGIAQAQRGE